MTCDRSGAYRLAEYLAFWFWLEGCYSPASHCIGTIYAVNFERSRLGSVDQGGVYKGKREADFRLLNWVNGDA